MFESSPPGTATLASEPSLDLTTFGQHTGAILDNLQRVINGKRDVVTTALITLLAEGHLLVEDVPGVGKTTLAKALARSVGCSVNRIQFTPDLLPSDVTGVSVYNQHELQFEFKPGAVFANIVVADEINRASPKTQSALLECMEERQVSIDGHTHILDAPFSVIATQNPIEMEGTYALPEAQRDRFMARVSMGYPDPQAELAMLHARELVSPLDTLEPVVGRDELLDLIETARQIYVAPSVEQYAVSLVQATRTNPDIRLGASPRATLHLVRAAKVRAGLEGREYVVPDDVDALVIPVLAHRIVPSRRSGAEHQDGESAIAALLHRIIAATPVPRMTAS